MSKILLKNGEITLDPRLDRIVQFDERSRNFPVTAIITEKKLRSYTWRCKPYLDQGQEGACVGFSWAHEIAARPRENAVSEEQARIIYREAQKIDEWPGEAYEGTSVLAGAKVVAEQGHVAEYRWAFGLNDALLAIGYQGPGVAGLNWYEGMRRPDENGFIHPTGARIGGHAILVNGVNVREKYVRLHNSWGADWGIDGDCFLSFEDFDRLLHERGEFCVPVVRKSIKLKV